MMVNSPLVRPAISWVPLDCDDNMKMMITQIQDLPKAEAPTNDSLIWTG